MRLMLAAAALAVVLSGCATVDTANEGEPGTTAVVMRDGDRWTVDFDLGGDAPVWGFTHSAQMRDGRPQWRPAQWRVLTPGVVLDRGGFRDVIRSEDGGPVPRRVRIEMTPASADVAASYNPALTFSDGSVALFSGQFDVFPLASLQAATDLPSDLNGLDLGAGPVMVTWRDRSDPVLFRGERVAAPEAAEADTYVLFGQAGLVEHDSLATVVDPAMPQWIQQTITDFAPTVTAYYAQRLGGGPEVRPTVMASWRGPTARMSSMGGSVLPGLIVAAFEGEGVVESSPEMESMARWFVGHESAHFWLGQTVHYETARDSWITEGGADLMAVRAMGALDSGYDVRAALQSSVDDCVTLAGNGGVADAADRGEHQAWYACGAVFALAAEGALARQGGGDWFDFLRPLMEANRDDGVLTRAEWLAHLTTVSGDSAMAEAVSAMLDRATAAPDAAVSALLSAGGVAHERVDGKIVLM